MSDIELVKSRLDIVEVLSQYIELKPAGSNYRALSPFKQEKTPSFMVSPRLQIFKDFSSGIGGDVIKFIQEFERLNFREALEKAAEIAGVELSGHYVENKEFEDKKKKLYEANELTTKFYMHILKTHKLGKAGRDYAIKRKISAKEIETFMFGYAPGGYTNLVAFLERKGFNRNDLVEFGLAVERNGRISDKFRNRLMQPIFDMNGKVVGFSGRYIGSSDNAPKYLNSPETIVYKKNELLYSLFHAASAARQEKELILVEGNIDIVSSHRVGVQNIVAPLGTAFTESQAKLIKRFADVVIFCFDTDEAGINALVRAIPIVEKIGLRHKAIELGNYQDADELICHEPEQWSKKIEEAINTIDYLRKVYDSSYDLGAPEGRRQFKEKLLPLLAEIRDSSELAYHLEKISVDIGISQDALNKDLEEFREKKHRNLKNSTKIAVIDDLPGDLPIIRETYTVEKYLLGFITQFQDIPVQTLDAQAFQNEHPKALLEILQEVGNTLDHESIQMLTDELRDLYEEVCLIQIPSDTNSTREKTFEKLYNRLVRAHLTKRLMDLRKKLNLDEDNETLLKEFDEISHQLKQYS